jgi:hypothetical protein
MGKGAANGEMADIDAARHDDEIDGVSRPHVAQRRILAGEEAHFTSLPNK